MTLNYFCFVKKTFFKYVLLFSVILTSGFIQLNAHELILNSNSQSSSTFISDSENFIDTFFSETGENSEDGNVITLIENEFDDDDESKSQKNKIIKKHSFVSINKYCDASIVIRDVNNDFHSYPHSEEIFACWYKLYQVFRI